MQTQTSTQDMIKELKEVKNVFSNCEKPGKQRFDDELEQQARLELAMSLQVSLDVDTVINTFMEYIHAYLLFDGFTYSCSQPDIQINHARQQGHRCVYNLDLEGANLGALNVYRGRKFAESELMLLENLLTLLIYPLRNAIQYKKASLLAHCDALTGAKNRSTFDDSLGREISLAQRYGQDFTLLVVDIDHFKKINDTYGHSSGDEVLKAVTTTFQASIRATDMLFRYGGEEFVILLSNSDCQQSSRIADRVLGSVRDINMQLSGQEVDLSVSIGMACLDVQDTAQTLFDRADAAMYEAKNEGRDQIKVA
ncbi:diguanylate cyclase (GGDEF domain) with PAS/PAC sensor [hydrothermal vent metagenome]|uniref:Diguanylate cyclase (GGDEF domain) with PAS/PAC sensor n=1 Tax=hydrothermal vent metagenome TaxID=652676 RepID=A0A3B0X740_9ZZZZ